MNTCTFDYVEALPLTSLLMAVLFSCTSLGSPWLDAQRCGVWFGKGKKAVPMWLIKSLQIGYFRCTLMGMLNLQNSKIREFRFATSFKFCVLKTHQISVFII